MNILCSMVKPNKSTWGYVPQHVLLAVNVNLAILDILMALVWLKMSATLVALIKLSNHAAAIVVNQLVECQIVPTGIVIIRALRDVNVMLGTFVTFWVVVLKRLNVRIHFALLTKKCPRVTITVRT